MIEFTEEMMVILTEPEFMDVIDEYIHADELIAEAQNSSKGFGEALALHEESRNSIIKGLFTFSHKWDIAHVLEADGFQRQQFFCKDCHYRASIFENINCLSIIKKVDDKMPVYDTHNQYIKFECDFIKKVNHKYPNARLCLDCALPEPIKTAKCLFKE